MSMLANILVAAIAILHIYILILEMFLWESPRGRKSFNTTPEFAKATKALAANQGLYNGFLAAGLIWGLLLGTEGNAIKVFFLGCVIVAGIFGALTANKRIFFIQALPAIITLIVLLLA